MSEKRVVANIAPSVSASMSFARRDSQALLTLSVDNRDAVDGTLDPRDCGRRPLRSQTGAGPWLHVQPSVEDPNGYVEIVWMDAAVHAGTPETA